MGLDLVATGRDVPEEINVVIEIPKDSEPVKYEVDKESGAIFVDRVLSTPMRYPCNYGYVPHTLSGDGDPADVRHRARQLRGFRCEAVSSHGKPWMTFDESQYSVQRSINIMT